MIGKPLRGNALLLLFPIHIPGADLAPTEGIQGERRIDLHKLRRDGAMLEMGGAALFFKALL